jgi:hypothetical protein
MKANPHFLIISHKDPSLNNTTMGVSSNMNLEGIQTFKPWPVVWANCVSPLHKQKIYIWTSDPPVPQNVILFGDKIFMEVIKLKWSY